MSLSNTATPEQLFDFYDPTPLRPFLGVVHATLGCPDPEPEAIHYIIGHFEGGAELLCFSNQRPISFINRAAAESFLYNVDLDSFIVDRFEIVKVVCID